MTVGYNIRAQYWYYHNVSTTLPKNLDTIFILSAGPSFDWKIDNPPSIETLDSYTDQEVEDWQENYRKDTESNIEDWTPELKALAKATLAALNILGLDKTEEQWIAFIRAQL